MYLSNSKTIFFHMHVYCYLNNKSSQNSFISCLIFVWGRQKTLNHKWGREQKKFKKPCVRRFAVACLRFLDAVLNENTIVMMIK